MADSYEQYPTCTFSLLLTDLCLSSIPLTAPSILLHLSIMFLSFIGLSITCDEFLVPTLEVVCLSYSLSEDVAGVTFMALGSAAPEIVINGVSTLKTAFEKCPESEDYNHEAQEKMEENASTNLGVGAILGSGIIAFTLIPGIIAISAPINTNLQLKRRPLIRDVLAYFCALCVLVYYMGDGVISFNRGVALVAMYVLFICVVLISPRINEMYFKKVNKQKWAKKRSFVLDRLESLKLTSNVNFVRDAEEKEKEKAEVARGNGRGSVRFSVPAETDRLISSPEGNENDDDEEEEEEDDLQKMFAGEKAAYDTSHPSHAAASRNDITRSPDRSNHFYESDGKDADSSSDTFVLKFLKRAWTGFDDDAEARDFADSENSKDLFDFSFDHPPEPISLSLLTLLISIPTFLLKLTSFSLRTLLMLTIPRYTVHDPSPSSMILPLTSFLLSFLWVSFYSFLISTLCERIVHLTGVSGAYYGVLLVSIGAEIPDTIQCLTVSRRGYGSMALSNALGSQVINILVGLGMPWTVSALADKPVTVSAHENLIGAASFLIVAILSFAMLLIVPVLIPNVFAGGNRFNKNGGAKSKKAYLMRWKGWIFLGSYLTVIIAYSLWYFVYFDV